MWYQIQYTKREKAPQLTLPEQNQNSLVFLTPSIINLITEIKSDLAMKRLSLFIYATLLHLSLQAITSPQEGAYLRTATIDDTQQRSKLPTRSAVLPPHFKETGKIAHHQVIVIGGGPAGLVAALYCARAKLDTLVLEEGDGGQLAKAISIKNWPGEIEISGDNLVEKIHQQAVALGVQFVERKIQRVELTQKPFILQAENGHTWSADILIIASGTKAKSLGSPGEEEFMGKRVHACAICDGPLYQDKNVFVIGGGTSALNNALLLSKFTQQITLIEATDQLTAYPDLQEDFFRQVPHANILYNTEVVRMDGTAQEGMQSITVHNKKTGTTEILHPDGVFICVGLQPNTKFLGTPSQLRLDERRRVVVHDFVRTSLPGVYAVGTVTNIPFSQAVIGAGFGAIAGIYAERELNSNATTLYNQYIN